MLAVITLVFTLTVVLFNKPATPVSTAEPKKAIFEDLNPSYVCVHGVFARLDPSC